MSGLRKLVWLLVLAPLAVALVAFAVANRHDARLVLDPLSAADPALVLDAPLNLIVFAALLTGVLVGGVAAWLGQAKWRRAARRQGQEAARWRREADRLKSELEAERRPRLPRAAAE